MATILKVLKFLWFFSGGGILLVVGGGLLVLVWEKIYVLDVLGILLIIVGVYLFSTTRLIRGEKMGVLDIMGSLEFQDSGFCLVPWPFAKLIVYLKKTFFFTYELKEVVTRAGKRMQTGIETEIGQEEVEEKYGAQVLKVNFGVYLNFPREKRLLGEVKTKEEIEKIAKEEEVDPDKIDKIKEREEDTHPLIKIRRAEVPVDEKGLKEWIGGVVGAALREVLGKLTWEDTITAREQIKNEVEKILRDPNEALVATGFSVKGIRFVITEIDLPEGLKKVMPMVDQRRLETKAASFEGKKREREIGDAIGMASRRLQEEYGFPAEEARRVATERHGDLIAAEKGHLTRTKIKWETSGGSAGGGSSSGGGLVSPETIAQAIAVYETIKRMPAGRRSLESGEEKPEIKKEEKEESPHERVQRKYKELKKLFGRE